MAVEVFHHRDEEYARWRADHPDGYILAVVPKRVPTLHRAGCMSLRGSRAGRSLTTTPKVCGLDRAEVEAWAREAGRSVVPCAICKPEMWGDRARPVREQRRIWGGSGRVPVDARCDRRGCLYSIVD